MQHEIIVIQQNVYLFMEMMCAVKFLDATSAVPQFVMANKTYTVRVILKSHTRQNNLIYYLIV